MSYLFGIRHTVTSVDAFCKHVQNTVVCSMIALHNMTHNDMVMAVIMNMMMITTNTIKTE